MLMYHYEKLPNITVYYANKLHSKSYVAILLELEIVNYLAPSFSRSIKNFSVESGAIFTWTLIQNEKWLFSNKNCKQTADNSKFLF